MQNQLHVSLLMHDITLYIIWLWCMLINTEFDSRVLLALLKCLLIANLKVWHRLSLLHPCRSLLPLSPSGGCEVFLWCYSTDLTMWQRKSHKTTQMCWTLQVQYVIYVLCGLWLTIKFIHFCRYLKYYSTNSYVYLLQPSSRLSSPKTEGLDLKLFVQ